MNCSNFFLKILQKKTSFSNNIFISYGSDDDGKRKSIEISKEFGFKWINPPNQYLPEVNDFYSLVVKYGIKELEKLLKYKNII